MSRKCVAAVLVAILGAGVARAEKTWRDDPRPHWRWVDAKPLKGGTPGTLVLEGREKTWYALEAGQDLELPVTGETRVLVYSRPDFASRKDPKATYHYLWSLNGSPETRAGFSSAPHPTATWKGLEPVPGTQDLLVLNIPKTGPNVLRIHVPAGSRRAIRFRLFIEERIRAGDPAVREREQSWTFGGEFRFKIAYDDNVWRFSDTSVHRLEDRKDSRTFEDIKSIDDFVIYDAVELDMRNAYAPGKALTVGLEMSDKSHLENRVKNTEEISLSVKHQFTMDDIYKIWGGWGPNRFVRNLNSSDIPGADRSRAHFDVYYYGARYWHRWGPRFSTTFQYEYEFKDYNTKFDERDQHVHHFVGGFRWRPIDMLTLDFDWTHTHTRSRALGDEVDVSSRENAPRLAFDLRLGSVLFGSSYRYEWREYTTRNPGNVDPSHADRWDRRHVFKVMAGYEFSRLKNPTTVTFEYTRTKKTSRVAGKQSADDSPDLDDSLEYDASTWELSIITKF